MFTLAHLSDPHLGPLPAGAAFRDFALKRLIGAANWRLRRHRFHDAAVAGAIAADIKSCAPDHVALTGDIVNVSARDEFPLAAEWLRRFGSPEWITFVPGNHDAYVPCAWEHGLIHLAPYMAGEMKLDTVQTTRQIEAPFPFVRLRRNVALIALSSAVPQPLYRAGGELGQTQLAVLKRLLRDLRERGYARVILIHHPPLPGMAPPRKALADASALKIILEQEGADLVLHGHNHQPMLGQLAAKRGVANIVGVPSASMAHGTHYPAAAWNLYRIARQGGKWTIRMMVRRWNPVLGGMETEPEFVLPS